MKSIINLSGLAYAVFAVIILSCSTNRSPSYYTGDKHQDSVIQGIYTKYNNLERVKTKKGKRYFGKDSIVYYWVNKVTNQLQSIGFTELKTDSRTAYYLINGDLVRVNHVPNNQIRSIYTIYFYDNGKFILKKERNVNSPDPQKFLDDVQFFKKELGLR